VDEIFGLFPTPFMRAPGTLPPPLVAGLIDQFTALATRNNNASTNLSHTEMLRPSDSPLLAGVVPLIAPKLADFGVHLFGERIGWLLKEMWVNVLDTGGRQAMHNHANSFVSGVAYLTPVSVRTRARPRFRRRAQEHWPPAEPPSARPAHLQRGCGDRQLLVVLLAYVLVRVPIAQRLRGDARRPALYAVGVLAAYWSWLRIAAIAF